MRSQSPKRAAQMRQRRKVLGQIVAVRGDRCEVPGCTRRADDAHEVLTRARGGSITDPANIRLVCRPHHDEITFREPAWAYKYGFLRHSWEVA